MGGPEVTPGAKRLVVVCGPTAAGKTRLGVALARVLNGEVVSADSMQIYRRMDIGTAKPTAEEMQEIPHHMLNVADPEESYSVARYVEQASARVEEIFARRRQPVIVGGTGLYIDALCAGQSFAGGSPQTRQLLRDRLQREGIGPLLEELAQVDAQMAARLHPNDQKRILRALEVFYDTGEPLSLHNERQRTQPPRYARSSIGLAFHARGDLHRQIDLRVDEMMARGLEEEVRGLLQSGLSPESTAMQAIGYKEMAAALQRGDAPTLAAQEIKLRSRQYAKRQLSWFRRDENIHWHFWGDNPNFSLALQDSIHFLRGEGLELCQNPVAP